MQIALLFARPGRTRRTAVGVVAVAFASFVAVEAVRYDAAEAEALAAAAPDAGAPAAARAALDLPNGMLPGADEPHATAAE